MSAGVNICLPPKGLAGVCETFGKFGYTELSKGGVAVDASWEADNLVTVRNICMTRLNVRLHRLVVAPLELALTDAIKTGYKVRMIGGFSPRHKMHDAKRGLSIHAWGAAIDINWDTNGVGTKSPHDMPRDFVKAFEHHGWTWGGMWRTPDYMHFQYCSGV